MGLLDALLGRDRGVMRSYEVRYVSALATEVLGYSAEKMYATQPTLRSVVSFIGGNVASIPLKCYIRESDVSRRRDTEGVLPTLLRHPNNHMTCHELMRHTVTDIELYGFALWLVFPDADSESGWRIEVLPASWVTQVKSVNGLEPSSYVIDNRTTGRCIEVQASDVIRFGEYSADGITSSSPVEALKQVLSEQISAWSYRNQVWKNGGRVSQVLERPAGIPWDAEDRDRFAESWKNRFAGNGGTDSGGTPILEDGMRLVSTTFNAHEAEWSEATKLAREDVAAVYHINPSLIWHTDAQTYASAKENARALYAETLQPILDMLSERMNAFLLPRLGVDPREYVEFDLSKKLEASFEERASVLQSAVGAPWMTRNEARAANNLPMVEGGDELIVPLNVIEGGLASPNDTSPYGGYDSASPQLKSAEAKDEPLAKVKAAPHAHDSMETASVLRSFVKRQRRKVIPAIDRAKSKGIKADGDWPSWWDAERWDRELGDDLFKLFMAQATEGALRTLRDVGISSEDFDSERMEAYIRKMAEGKATAFNNVTYRQLKKALDEEIGEDAEGATPEGVFDKAEADRADNAGISFATAVMGFSALEAMNQCAPPSQYRRMKTWVVTSGNPRPEHAAMDGETVGLDELFSNGARFPGDQVLTPDESCGCQCQVEITVWRV